MQMSLFGISIYLMSCVLLQLDIKTTVESINNANSSDQRHSIHYLRKFKLLCQNVILTFEMEVTHDIAMIQHTT